MTTRNHDLPASCLRDVRSVRGTHRMFGRGCLRNNYAYVNRLPARCEIQVTSNRRIRHGYSPQCLAEFGYGVNRRH